MPLVNASHDSLPYIDRPLTPGTATRVNNLVKAELPPAYYSSPPTLHPLLTPLREPIFSDLITKELDRVSQNLPIADGVDASRYESQTAPSLSSSSHEEWQNALKQAYTTSTHLSNRVTNLTLLSSFGRNSWLIGNSQMEAILGELERELVSLKEESEIINRERKQKQVEVQQELDRLERRWKDGVGKVLEIEVASEMVFREILERRRGG